MIYTIKCRRGHCGSSYDQVPVFKTHDKNADEAEREAKTRGWVRDSMGWLCPFDAPKDMPTPPEETHCDAPGCLNVCRTAQAEELVASSWLQIGLGERMALQADQAWLCPACRTNRPSEPAPAAKPNAAANFITCGMFGCHNAHMGDVLGSTSGLVKDGWHLVSVGEGGVDEDWFCPACSIECNQEGCSAGAIDAETALKAGWIHEPGEPADANIMVCAKHRHLAENRDSPAPVTMDQVRHAARLVAMNEIQAAFKRIKAHCDQGGDKIATRVSSLIESEAEVPF